MTIEDRRELSWRVGENRMINKRGLYGNFWVLKKISGCKGFFG